MSSIDEKKESVPLAEEKKRSVPLAEDETAKREEEECYKLWSEAWERHPGLKTQFTYGLQRNYPVKVFQLNRLKYYFAKPELPIKRDAMSIYMEALKDTMRFGGLCAQDVMLMIGHQLIEKQEWKNGPPSDDISTGKMDPLGTPSQWDDWIAKMQKVKAQLELRDKN